MLRFLQHQLIDLLTLFLQEVNSVAVLIVFVALERCLMTILLVV